MGDFDRNAGRRSSGRGRFDGGRSGGFSGRGRGRDRDEGRDRGRSGGFGGRDRPERHEMHSATCDKCGNECEVPFKPTQGKPLYCNDCFKDKNKEAGSTNNNGNLDQINEKLNKILKILEGHVKEDKPAKETKEKPKKETKEKPKKIEKEEPKLEYAENIEEKNPKKKKAKKKK